MARKNRKQEKETNEQKMLGRMNIPGEKQVYSGPLLVPGSMLQRDSVLVNLAYVTSVTASSAVVNSVYGTNVSLFNNYTNQTNAYDEFRLLRCDFEFIPVSENSNNWLTSTTDLINAPFIGCIDRDSSTAFSSYVGALEFASAKVKAINKTNKWTFIMDGSEDAAFFGSTSTSPAYLRTYASGLTSSGVYGYMFVKSLWQFRGRS